MVFPRENFSKGLTNALIEGQIHIRMKKYIQTPLRVLTKYFLLQLEWLYCNIGPSEERVLIIVVVIITIVVYIPILCFLYDKHCFTIYCIYIHTQIFTD